MKLSLKQMIKLYPHYYFVNCCSGVLVCYQKQRVSLEGCFKVINCLRGFPLLINNDGKHSLYLSIGNNSIKGGTEHKDPTGKK